MHITAHRSGFAPGWTTITDAREDETGLGLGVLRLGAGETFEERPPGEAAWLLMEGSVELVVADLGARLTRRSLFDEGPSCAHGAAGQPVRITAGPDGAELTVYRAVNDREFAPRVFGLGDVRNEHRGKGKLRDASYRFVRTIFDHSNTDPAAMLVLGEVITLPGRWSSYPPHHHPQPELYHYRFTHPEGYGHAELGESVFKVRAYDTVKILAPNDHAQTAAPGYGMYYSWVIRHLPEKPYGVPEFATAHRWLLEDDAPVWWPSDLDAAEDEP